MAAENPAEHTEKLVQQELINKVNKSITKNIRRFKLKTKTSSMKEFCEISGVNYQTIRNLGYFKNLPSLRVVILLSDAMHISIDELIGRKPFGGGNGKNSANSFWDYIKRLDENQLEILFNYIVQERISFKPSKKK